MGKRTFPYQAINLVLLLLGILYVAIKAYPAIAANKCSLMFHMGMTQQQGGELLQCMDIHPRGYVWASAILLNDNDYQGSIALLDKALIDNPDDEMAYYHLGLAYKASGDTNSAVRALSRVNAIEILLQYGQQLADRQMLEEAETVYRAVYELEPEKGTTGLSATLYSEGKYRESEQIVNDSLSRFPHSVNQYHWLITLGSIYMEEERFDEAILFYQRMLGTYPGKAEIHLQLGKLWELQGKIEMAITEIEFGIELSPNSYLGYEALALLLTRRQAYTEADEMYLLAQNLAPDRIWIKIGRANNAYLAGNYLGAAQFYQAILDQFEGVVQSTTLLEIYLSLTKTYLLLGEFQHALITIERAIAQIPDSVELWLLAGQVYTENGQIELAKESYNKVLLLSPGHEIAEERLNQIDR